MTSHPPARLTAAGGRGTVTAVPTAVTPHPSANVSADRGWVMPFVVIALIGLILACYLRVRMAITAYAPHGEHAMAAAAGWRWQAAAGLVAIAGLVVLTGRGCVFVQ